MTVTTAATTPRGWRPGLTGSSRVRLEPTLISHGRERQRRDQAGLLRGSRGTRPPTAPVPMSLPHRLNAGPSRIPNRPLHQRRANGPSPRRWGRSPVVVPRPPARGRQAVGVLALALARGATPSQGRCPLVRGLEPRCGVVRGPSVEAPAGEPFSLWGKVFDIIIFIFLCHCVLFV